MQLHLSIQARPLVLHLSKTGGCFAPYDVRCGEKRYTAFAGAEMRKAAKPISRAASAADARQARLRKGGKARGGRRRRTPGPAGPGAAKLLQYPMPLF